MGAVLPLRSRLNDRGIHHCYWDVIVLRRIIYSLSVFFFTFFSSLLFPLWWIYFFWFAGIDCDEARNREEHMMLEDAKEWLSGGGDSVDPLQIHTKTGATALHVAAAKGYIKVMSILLQGGFYRTIHSGRTLPFLGGKKPMFKSCLICRTQKVDEAMKRWSFSLSKDSGLIDQFN